MTEGVELSRQYDLIVSPTGAYEIRCFKGAWSAPQANEDLDAFVRDKLLANPQAQPGRGQVGTAPAAWVAVRLSDRPFMLYRLAFVHGQRRYIANVLAPVLADPGVLPLPIAYLFKSIEFPPSTDVADNTNRPAAPDKSQRAPAPDTLISQGPPSVPTDWPTVSLDDFRLRVPPDWIAVASANAREGRWLRGNEEEFDASFSVLRNLAFADLGAGMQVDVREETTVAGLPAEVYLGKFSDSGRPGKGMMVFVQAPSRSGGTVALCCHAAETQWHGLRMVFERMLKSIETVGEAGRRPDKSTEQQE